jgi:cathepsin L
MDFETFKATVLMRNSAAPTRQANATALQPTKALSTRRALPGNAKTVNVDWRLRGKTTPVKDQGQCGSCWAFAAVSSIESALLITEKNNSASCSIDLSEQQLVDCIKAAPGYSSLGCDGGFSDDAMNYATVSFLATEDISPYQAVEGEPSRQFCLYVKRRLSVCIIPGVSR